MTDGESPESLPRPAGGEVRVPITVPPRRPAEPPPEDAGSGGSPGRDPPPDLASEEEEQVPYPALAPTAFFCLKQTTRPRSWCLRLVCNPYPFPEGQRTPPRGYPSPGPPLRTPSGFCIPGARCSLGHTVMPRSPQGPQCLCVVPIPTSGSGMWGSAGVGQAGSVSPLCLSCWLHLGDAHTEVPMLAPASSHCLVWEQEGWGGRTRCSASASHWGVGCRVLSHSPLGPTEGRTPQLHLSPGGVTRSKV
ncbi:basic proline-rich protein-like [Pezoporus wallicus]|uniref:basic proline-rich protein-like n=1 Tax=Pezoporus wallicus TaxID=35540 RepID=UPI00254A0D27|nr:basic proline-rich protein-like [Pezoporus wallicus]